MISIVMVLYIWLSTNHEHDKAAIIVFWCYRAGNQRMKQTAANKSKPPKCPKQNADQDGKTRKSDRTIQVSGSKVNIQINADEPRTLGSTNQDFQHGFVSQLLNITTKGREYSMTREFTSRVEQCCSVAYVVRDIMSCFI